MIARIRYLPGICCAALLAVWGGRLAVEANTAEPRPEVLARVGDREITEDDMAGRGAYRFDLALDLEADRPALRDAIEEELLLQEALRRGLEREDPVARRRLAMRIVEDEVISPAAFEITDDKVKGFYLQQPERYSGPKGTIAFDLVEQRVRGDLMRVVLAKRYRALVERLSEEHEIDVTALSLSTQKSGGSCAH